MDGIRFGRGVVALRKRRDWTQEELAARARLSRSVVGRAERGQVARISYGDLESIARTLDGRLGLDFWWRGEGLDRLIDERHAALVDAVVRLFASCGWEVDVEVSFSIYGERGSIDAFARHVATGLIAVVDVKASLTAVGATLIGLDRKGRLAPRIARERGWACNGVSVILVVPDTSTTQRRLARHADAFAAALPTGSRDVRTWIRHPSAATPPRGILFVNPPDVHRAARRRTRRPSRE